MTSLPAPRIPWSLELGYSLVIGHWSLGTSPLMPTFQYKALQADGSIAEGEMEAGGRQEAFRQMEGRGLRPIRLAERSGGNGAGKPAAKPLPKEAADKRNAVPSSSSGKLSFGSANKMSARMLENFTRLL